MYGHSTSINNNKKKIIAAVEQKTSATQLQVNKTKSFTKSKSMHQYSSVFKLVATTHTHTLHTKRNWSCIENIKDVAKERYTHKISSANVS